MCTRWNRFRDKAGEKKKETQAHKHTHIAFKYILHNGKKNKKQTGNKPLQAKKKVSLLKSAACFKSQSIPDVALWCRKQN